MDTMETYDREKTCCFTGHRAEKLPWRHDEQDPRCLRLKTMLADALGALYAAGYRRFLCGMASGGDMYFGEAAAALREERPDVTLEAVVPFEGQERGWPAALRRRYARLCEAADRVTVIGGEDARESYLARDRYMVDHASVVLAAYAGGPGGTRYTIDYALKCGLRVIELPI